MVAFSRIFTRLAWVLLLFLCTGAAMSSLPSEISDIIDRRFSKWDLNRDRRLSTDEIDQAVANPLLRDTEAAAMAALKRGLAGHIDAGSGSGKEQLQQRVDARTAEGQHFRELFSLANKRIQQAQRRLFASGRPQLATIHQGQLGNCFVLAPLGAVLAVTPDRVSQMFTSGPADGYYVRFGKYQIPVPKLTDAELALTAGNEGDGVWVNVYEKAAGAAQKVIGPAGAAKGSAIDAISSGGSVTNFLSLITGRQIQRFSFEFTRRDDKGTRQYRDSLQQLRTWLDDARRERHAMVCTTRDSRTPGLASHHAWAVIAWDNASDTITLWNPHGGNFRPAGSSGPVHGYPASQGILKIPLEQFIRLFSGMARETETPASGSRELPALPE